MITVRLGENRLEVCGHAGFSRFGTDIVCAAASMLAFALAEAVQAVPGRQPVITVGCGMCAIEAFPAHAEQARLRGMFETAAAGYRLLAERYPEYVRVMGAARPADTQEDPGERPPDGQKEETA